MSDAYGGPGWWMASDGLWYSPTRHPDENYRKQYLTPAPEVSQLDTYDDGTQAFPTVGISEEVDTSATVTQSLSDMITTRSAHMDETAEMSGEQLKAQLEEVERQRREAEARAKERNAQQTTQTNKAQSFSIASRSFTTPPERPVFENTAPPSVVAAPPRQQPIQRIGRTEVELQRAANSSGPTAGPLSLSSVKAEILQPPKSTSLVHLPNSLAPVAVGTTRDRIISTLLFCSGVAMIVGTFLNWTTGTVTQTGWERGDGIATVLAGIVGSAMAGPIFVGFRHLVPKMTAIVAGLVGLVVVGLAAISGVLDATATGITLGAGFFVVLGGSIAMVAAAIADHGEQLD